MTVRVRFAPSPTGSFHIGSARTALYNYLFARHMKGSFLLRVEDTDRERNTEESLRTILEGMDWLGLKYDEEPVYQSQRVERHQEAANQLLDSGKAYWREDEGKGKALVFRIDREKVEWPDAVHGPLGRDLSDDPDLVILKSDGRPTYNLAVVVDDIDMKITHVIRGDDHISNTPKQICLYRALGQEAPIFAHIPLILDPGGAKISKRKEYDFPVSVQETQQAGYLPEAFINFLVLLGWSPGDDRELMPIEEMIEAFTLERCSTTPARFLRNKLDFMNGHYIREGDPDRILDLCKPYLEARYSLGDLPEGQWKPAVQVHQSRIKRLDEISDAIGYVLSDEITYLEKAERKWLQKEGVREILQELKTGLQDLPSLEQEPVEHLLKSLAEKHDVKMNRVAQPLRVALTGRDASPSMHDTLGLLGKERSIERIDKAMERLPG
jgi:glutamyl-tRNA synthetase